MTEFSIFFLWFWLHINSATVESKKLLGVHITEDLIWPLNTCLGKKSQQNIHFLQRLKRANLPTSTFYRECPDQLSHCLDWDLHRLRMQESTAEWESNWEDYQDLFTLPSIFLTMKTASAKPPFIIDDLSHSSPDFFTYLPSGRIFAFAFGWCF